MYDNDTDFIIPGVVVLDRPCEEAEMGADKRWVTLSVSAAGRGRRG